MFAEPFSDLYARWTYYYYYYYINKWNRYLAKQFLSDLNRKPLQRHRVNNILIDIGRFDFQKLEL